MTTAPTGLLTADDWRRDIAEAETRRLAARSAAEKAGDPTTDEAAAIAEADARVAEGEQAVWAARERLAAAERAWAQQHREAEVWRLSNTQTASPEIERASRALQLAYEQEGFARVEANEVRAAIAAAGRIRRTRIEAGR